MDQYLKQNFSVLKTKNLEQILKKIKEFVYGRLKPSFFALKISLKNLVLNIRKNIKFKCFSCCPRSPTYIAFCRT